MCGLWTRIGSAVSSGWNRARNGVNAVVNNVKSGVGNAFNATKEGVKKGWKVTKNFASKHAETIGNVAGAALNVAAPALDAALGIPVGSIIQSGAKKLAKHYAKNDTGWGRFAKGLSGGSTKSKGSSELSKQLTAQSNAINESNGHVAAGYSISSTGNNTKPFYNGKHRMKSWVL